MIVIKRDGTKEEFNPEKIEKAILKAFKSCDYKLGEVDRKHLADFIDSLDNGGLSALDTSVTQEVSVEDIQNKVEKFLCKRWFPVGKAYMLYREKHKEARLIKDKLQFIHKYTDSDKSATDLSNTDSNANASQKNSATLEGELYKDTNRLVQRAWMKELLKEIDSPYKDNYLQDLENHILYQHDETGGMKPYTYSAKEVVEVQYNGKELLLPLDLLYDIVATPEKLVDTENEVYQKYPYGLFVKDVDGVYSKVTILTKKRRHRPLVRVKTAFGEDLVVTDNHPLIVDKDNVENTVEAVNSLGQKQYRTGSIIKFKGGHTLDLVKILPTWVSYGDDYIKYQQSTIKRFIPINRDLGYIVGFFIGDGGYNNTFHYLDISQKDRDVLEDINNKCYNCFGFMGRIALSGGSNREKFVLSIKNRYIYELFRGFFKIQDKAQNKTLPYNILEFNEEFAKGCLEGLIDADGTIVKGDCNINIRLSSRACVLQCTYLFRHFGYSIGNNMQSLPFSNNTSYHSNYTIWGINATKREDSADLSSSFKIREKLINTKCKSLKYKSEGYCNISSVDEIEKESAFNELCSFIYDITTESHTFVSNNLLVHNCSAYTLYPLLVDGTGNIDGTKNHAPHHLSSFCGQFQNLVFLLSAQKKGAGAYGEFFNCFSYFCEKEWGERYYEKADVVITNEHCLEQRTIGQTIDQYFQSVTHYINQPAGNRGYQSPFTNFNVFDSYYWHTMFDDFYFPDGTQPHWDAVNWLQKRYMKWLNEERTKTLLTFPVMTVCCLTDGKDVLDKEYKDFITTQWAEGDSFFVYLSENADSISSCCRLRNEITENTFSSTTGLTGVQTGSCNVMTLNLNRIVQDWFSLNCWVEDERGHHQYKREFILKDTSKRISLQKYLESILDRVYDYQKAYKTGLYKMDAKGMFPQTKAGYISLDKLYCTIGVNGLNEAARFLGMTVSNNKDYRDFASWLLGIIKQDNKKHSEKKFMYNLELVPAESLGVKNYNWDKADGYWVPDDENLYNSYIYDAHDSTSILDKIAMQGGNVAKSIDGGQASHLNLQDNLDKEQYTKLLEYAVQVGNSYITFNVPQTQCDDCGFIAKHPFDKCPKCGSEHTTMWTRIIGFLRPIKAWSKERQIEGGKRMFAKKEEVC